MEIRGGGPADPGPRVRLLSSPQDELLAIATVGRDGAFEIQTTVPSSRLPLIARLEVDRPGWVACGPLPGVHLVGTLPFEREGVRLAIAPGLEVRGRVTTVAGEPLHPPVRIVQPSEDSSDAIAGLFLRATTDRDGFFRASLPSTEEPVVLAQADGYLTVAEQWDTIAQESLEIVMPREAELPHVTGRVVRGDGRTGEAARVTARLLETSSRDLPAWAKRALAQRALYLRTGGEEPNATRADGRGRYSLTLPSAGTWLLELRGAFGTAERRVEVGGSGSIRCDAVLGGDTFDLSGSVTDRSDGMPVRGALVRLRCGTGRFGRHGDRRGPSSSTRTDERGEFRIGPLLRDLEKGELEVEAPEYVVRREDLVFGDLGSPPTVAVSVVRECRVLGRVVCADGSPAPGVFVDTDPRPDSTWTGCEIPVHRTNADGRFLVAGLPSGIPIRVRATARSAEADPCFSASEIIPHDLWRVAEIVVSRGRGETIDLGDMVLSGLVPASKRGRRAEPAPDPLPSSGPVPR
ncbi:MAG: carboxypeptidase-like regulatory domain-containing protein [Planctomycetes bacterium]|nr:carboxypeptidase-like regulatory domain-containing protein [Planctomycetota bacterium]